jgi:hypothetical protein
MVRIEGVVSSPYNATPIEFLECLLCSVTAQGANISQARAGARVHWIGSHAPGIFAMGPQTVESGVRFDLVCSYRFSGRSQGQEQNLEKNIGACRAL